jgi:hypothetical protein
MSPSLLGSTPWRLRHEHGCYAIDARPILRGDASGDAGGFAAADQCHDRSPEAATGKPRAENGRLGFSQRHQ